MYGAAVPYLSVFNSCFIIIITICALYVRIYQQSVYLEGTCVFVSPELVHLHHLLFPFLESSEVILDQERRVELTDCDIIVS